jgi:hypothetical protein
MDEHGEVLARSEGLFIAIDPERVLAKLAANREQAKTARSPRPKR